MLRSDACSINVACMLTVAYAFVRTITFLVWLSQQQQAGGMAVAPFLRQLL